MSEHAEGVILGAVFGTIAGVILSLVFCANAWDWKTKHPELTTEIERLEAEIKGYRRAAYSHWKENHVPNGLIPLEDK